ncbi:MULTISPECIES: mechanosensitive ion channel family protein [Flavobacteriaceae]|uniref:Mechanosensitive ion channel n=1 Tax=Flagellimonas alvinocaridis TaxID=2530200 RepID=A0A4S8RKX2_9FLAO|nr:MULTISPECIES: mechanosensitive ion channel [Allomuricauda]MDC6361215.1 mechanosensitive ion channel [Muricauda sp. SP22]THV59143.1 mechanosensitive ion channel [Allomuricauda alvinocaridis]
METLSNWKNVTLDSLSSMGKNIGAALPKIVGAIAILILGWLIIKIVLFILSKILKLAKMDALSERINEMDLLGNGKFKIDIIKITLGFVKWLLLLVFFIVAADILDWGIISTEIGNLLRYLPRLFTALVLFTIGLYLGSVVKNAIKKLFESFEFGGGKIISGLMFYVIVIFMSITALNQAGVDTTIITNNITLILGSFLLAFALGLGLGSREIVTDLLRSFYTRKNYAVGDKIAIGGDEGTIAAIENNSLTLVTKTGKFVIPIKDVVSQKVEIKS